MEKYRVPELTEEQVQAIAKALADPRRYGIIKRISRCTRPMACETIRECLDITAPTLSHHMKELETAGLIRGTRFGKCMSYELRRDVFELFLASLHREFIGDPST